MAKQSESGVSWGHLLTIIGLMVVIVGGGLAWLHGDMSDLKTDVREVTKAVNDLGKQVAVTNTKLDDLLQETKRARQSR